MIDFKNAAYVKLRPIGMTEGEKAVSGMIVDDEEIISAFQSIRDMVIFTNKRIIAINVKGLTGTKKDFSSLPYSKVQAFSVETAGILDLDCELELWFSGLGKVKLEFVGNFDIAKFNKVISNYIL